MHRNVLKADRLRRSGSEPSEIDEKMPSLILCRYANEPAFARSLRQTGAYAFLQAAEIESRAALRVFRDVAMFMRM